MIQRPQRELRATSFELRAGCRVHQDRVVGIHPVFVTWAGRNQRAVTCDVQEA